MHDRLRDFNLRRMFLPFTIATTPNGFGHYMIKYLFAISALVLFSGCASNQYNYGTGEHGGDDSKSPPMQQQLYVGAPSKILDASDWIWPGSLLAKLVLWNKNIDSHEVSDETIDAMMQYVKENELDDVQILVNTYKPANQWSRLFKNKEIWAPFRYTLGVLSTSLYTVLPGRFFGGDHYNPYTNTINIYSDEVAIALHEAGHAKDLNSRKNKTLHSTLYIVPGAPLYYEAVASSDAINYLNHQCRYDEEKRAYKVLHPAYGTYAGGVFLRQSGLGFVGAIPGHITGAIASLGVNKSEDEPCENILPEALLEE